MNDPVVGPHAGFIQPQNRKRDDHRRSTMPGRGGSGVGQSLHELTQVAHVGRAMFHVVVDIVGRRTGEPLPLFVPANRCRVVDRLPLFEHLDGLVDPCRPCIGGSFLSLGRADRHHRRQPAGKQYKNEFFHFDLSRQKRLETGLLVSAGFFDQPHRTRRVVDAAGTKTRKRRNGLLRRPPAFAHHVEHFLRQRERHHAVAAHRCQFEQLSPWQPVVGIGKSERILHAVTMDAAGLRPLPWRLRRMC